MASQPLVLDRGMTPHDFGTGRLRLPAPVPTSSSIRDNPKQSADPLTRRVNIFLPGNYKEQLNSTYRIRFGTHSATDSFFTLYIHINQHAYHTKHYVLHAFWPVRDFEHMFPQAKNKFGQFQPMGNSISRLARFVLSIKDTVASVCLLNAKNFQFVEIDASRARQTLFGPSPKRVVW